MVSNSKGSRGTFHAWPTPRNPTLESYSSEVTKDFWFPKVTGDRFGFVTQAFCNIGVAIVIAFIYGWQLTLLVLAFLPPIALSGMLQMKFQRGSAATQKSSNESIGKVRTVSRLPSFVVS